MIKCSNHCFRFWQLLVIFAFSSRFALAIFKIEFGHELTIDYMGTMQMIFIKTMKAQDTNHQKLAVSVI